MSETKRLRDITILNRSQPQYPKPSKRQNDIELQASSVDFDKSGSEKEFLQQMHYQNQIKYKILTNKGFLPKIKNTLEQTGRSFKSMTLRQISKGCIRPLSNSNEK